MYINTPIWSYGKNVIIQSSGEIPESIWNYGKNFIQHQYVTLKNVQDIGIGVDILDSLLVQILVDDSGSGIENIIRIVKISVIDSGIGMGII